MRLSLSPSCSPVRRWRASAAAPLPSVLLPRRASAARLPCPRRARASRPPPRRAAELHGLLPSGARRLPVRAQLPGGAGGPVSGAALRHGQPLQAGLPPTDGAPGTSDLDGLPWKRGAPSTADPGAAGLPMADPGASVAPDGGSRLGCGSSALATAAPARRRQVRMTCGTHASFSTRMKMGSQF